MRHLILHTLIHLLTFAFSQIASGEVHQFRTTSAGFRMEGSAVSVGKNKAGDYILLTSAHAFRGMVIGAHVGVDGKWIRVTLKESTLTAGTDLAICTFKYAGKISCTKIAIEPPVVGTECSSLAYADGVAVRIRGKVASVSGNLVRTTAAKYHRQGMSGGAMLLTDGKCFAIISGYERRWNRSSGRIHTACLRLFGRSPS